MLRWPLLLTDFTRDAVHAIRLFGRARAFTALAVLTLALGVGANTAIFSVVHALLLRPLPYPEPDRLVFLDGAFRARGSDTAFQLSYPEMTDVAGTTRLLTLVTPWTTGYGLAVEGTAGAARLQANFVGRSYFDLLGARPLAGRLFANEEHDRGSDGRLVAVLSEAAWRQQFGGDPSTVGRDVRLQGRPFTIVGIMPATFDDPALAYSERIDVWVPIERAPALVGVDLTARGSRLTWGFARLAAGATPATAQAELMAISRQLESAYPQTNASFTLRAAPLAASFFRDARRPLWMLLGGSLFVLLIGCANVANLVLVRSSARARELAVRLAIGASRGRVVRQLLTESLVLALAGGICGVLIASWLAPVLVAVSGINLPGFAAVGLDRTVLASALTTSILCGLLSGLAPVWHVTRVSLRHGVAAGATHAPRRSRTALWLAGVEVAAAFVLTAGSLMMLQSFSALTRTGLSFRSERLLTVRLDLPQDRYATPASRVRFAERARETLSALPGVQAVMLWGPSMFARSTWIAFVAPADRVVPDSERVMLWRHSTNPGALQDLGIPLVAGRDFGAGDTLDAPPVAIVSESGARRLWPDQNAVGRQLRMGSGATATTLTVVGVAADARHRGRFRFSEGASAHEAQLDLYLPFAQRPNALVTIGIRTAGDPAGATHAVSAAIGAIDPALPVYDVAPLDDRLRLEERSVGVAALLLNLYGGLALLLAAIGVYGVLAAGVAARLRELGIRAALGAEPRRIQLGIVRQALLVSTAAVCAGGVIAAAVGASTRALFFDASVADLRVLGGAALVLLAVAVVASAAPARRASRVDLVRVLTVD